MRLSYTHKMEIENFIFESVFHMVFTQRSVTKIILCLYTINLYAIKMESVLATATTVAAATIAVLERLFAVFCFLIRASKRISTETSI